MRCYNILNILSSIFIYFRSSGGSRDGDMKQRISLTRYATSQPTVLFLLW